MGEWESPRAGDGRVGEWGSGRWGSGGVGEWGSGKCGGAGNVENLHIDPLPSSFFLLLFDGMSFVESFQALPVAHKPPVPRLVTDALAIVFGKGHFKAESGCVGF